MTCRLWRRETAHGVGQSWMEDVSMPSRLVRKMTAASLFFGAGASFGQVVLPASSANAADKAVAAKALQIVSDIHGVWPTMPANIVTTRMTGGALIGNGSVGVAIGGTPDKQQFYIGRDDFWSVLRGSIMPVGQLQLTVPSLQGGSSELSENIGPANVTGIFVQGNSQLRTQSWVAAGQNTLFVQLENSGQTAMQVSAAMLDGFGQKDRDTLGGVTGDVSWLKVSPEVVQATIGGITQTSRQGPGVPPKTEVIQMSDARIRSVRVFDSYLPPACVKA